MAGSAHGRALARGGDVLVTQTRGAIGVTPKQRANLRSLGLGEVGKKRVHNSHGPHFKGMVAVVREWVAVTGLVTDGDAHVREVDIVTDAYARADQNDKGWVHDIRSGGGWLRVEINPGFLAMSWPTLITARTAWRRLLDLVGADTEVGECQMTYQDGHAQTVAAFDAVTDSLTERSADDVTFFSVDLPQFTFAWRGSVHGGTGTVARGEVALSSDLVDPSGWERLLKETGSPSVGENAKELIELAAQDASGFKTGSILPEEGPSVLA